MLQLDRLPLFEAKKGVGVRMTQRQNDTVRLFGTEGHFGIVTN